MHRVLIQAEHIEFVMHRVYNRQSKSQIDSLIKYIFYFLFDFQQMLSVVEFKHVCYTSP